MLKKLILLIMFIAVIITSVTLYQHFKSNNPQSKLSLFSWSSNEITHNRKNFVNDVIEYEFKRVFQLFPNNVSEKEIISFVLELTERNIEVYALSGSAEWALESTGESMIEQLNMVVQINQQLPKKKKMKGLVIDVEPYLLEDFDWEDERIQNSFISAMKNLYQVAQKEQLELIVVVPYFYDTKGYKDVLTTLIHEASSEVAVMNYYRDKEIEHIAFEAKEAKKATKPLTTIYEFKRPGEHDLTEKNTYFYKGYLSAMENATRLIEHFHEQTIHIAFHDYHAFREVINID